MMRMIMTETSLDMITIPDYDIAAYPAAGKFFFVIKKKEYHCSCEVLARVPYNYLIANPMKRIVSTYPIYALNLPCRYHIFEL